MDISKSISSRFWNLPQKPDEEVERENTFIDDIIAKAHIEREILSQLDGVETVFDGGAGYGRFSIPLAKQGCRVTHLDISQPMIERAKAIAAEEGVLDRMTFIHGSLEELQAFEDGQFDMVLSLDAPISYTYPNQEAVIGELVRVCSRKLIVSVYSRPAWTYLFDPAQKAKYILDKDSPDPFVRWTLEKGLPQLETFTPDMPSVRRFFETGLMESPEKTAAEFEKGDTPWPISYTFMPDELEDILIRFGVKNIRLAGPGALSRSVPGEVLRNIMRDGVLKQEFLDFCYDYDRQPWCAGMGKDNLLASGDIC